MMTVDERIRYLLRIAIRAEGEGDLRIARTFRQMAEDARPLDAVLELTGRMPAYGCCAE